MADTYTLIKDLTTQLPDIPPDSIVSRTYYSDEQVKAILFGFAPGQELSEHTASKAAILHFLEGDAHLTLGKDPFDIGPGAWVHMPPHMPHSVLAITKVFMLLIMLES